MSETKNYTFSVRVENKFGVLSRIAGLFSGRGYNISSLTVNSTSDPEVSRMIIVTRGDDAVIEQIEKQLNKLIEVIRVDRLSGEDFIERELALFKLAADTPEKKAQVIHAPVLVSPTVMPFPRLLPTDRLMHSVSSSKLISLHLIPHISPRRSPVMIST